MTTLHRDTVLVRTPDVRVAVASSGAITADTDAGRIDAGPHGLSVLDCFTEPRCIADAMRLLGTRCRSPQDWADLGATIQGLHVAGVLREPADRGAPSTRHPGHYDRPGVHTCMLNDRTRTTLFIEALREVVRADDVVLDLGSGTGVLAVAAAQLGARHVYAMEATAIADVAERVADRNGVGDRVTILRGRSTQLTLPERATVVVSEMIGNDPLGERALDLLRDASLRLCRPGARFIPSSLELFLVPVAVSADLLAQRVPTSERIEEWRRSYGVDLSPLAALPRDGWEMTFARSDDKRIEPIGAPVSLGSLALGDAHGLPIRRHADLQIERDGELGGILLYFEAQLSPGVRLSLDPRGRPESHWVLPLWLRLSPIAVAAGDTWACDYQYRDSSELTVTRSGHRP